MDLGIKNKKAIICASSRGLGKACAESLAKEGVEIYINGVQEDNLKKTEKEFKDWKKYDPLLISYQVLKKFKISDF